MLAYVPTLAADSSMMIQEVGFGACDKQERTLSTSASGATVRPGLRVGPTRYEFLRQVRALHSWEGDEWVCWSPEVGWECDGRGETPLLAGQEWERKLHATFQLLYGKRQFEMSESERKQWQRLVAAIDVCRYRESTPLALRQIGQVRWGNRPYPSRILWIEGGEERFSLEQVPAALAGCRPGQWIEADVQRDPITNRLICIDHIQRIATVQPLTELQAAQAWAALPKSDLPRREWERPQG
jgi:hypothetical protein